MNFTDSGMPKTGAALMRKGYEMLRIEKRRIKKCQAVDMTIPFLNEYFSSKKRISDIILIFNNGNLKTLLAYEDYEHIKNQQQLDFYLKYNTNCTLNNDIESAVEIFKRFPKYNYLAVSIGNETGEFICRSYVATVKIDDIYMRLKKNNVNVYRVKIPKLKDIDNVKCYGVDNKHGIWEFTNLIADGELQEPQYIDKITDLKIGFDTKVCNVHGEVLGDKKRKIYLIGPCIAGGWTNVEKESLPEILYEKTEQSGYEYSILPIKQVIGNDKEDNLSILTYDIKKNDIVIFICNYSGDDWELDTTPLYNTYTGSKWLFQGQEPIHTTVTGNKIIADFLIENIVKPTFFRSVCSDDDTVIYKGEPQFPYDVQDKIEKYITNVRKTRTINSANADIGAIVMNCNPFTNGHRYLVEYASKQTDYLYLFVVEENLSAVPFSDRFIMVYEGVKDIDNVIVVPSGHFIISRDTFKNYFEKETDIHDVNAEEDVYIFARYIAKGLNISKRFVGEEPTDHVTNVYNQTMKKVFEKYEIELIEIPRKKLDNGNVISATEVRKFVLQDEWLKISQYVPQSTYNYLKKIRDTVKERIKNTDYIQSQMKEFADKVCSFDKVVIYTVGNNTKGLIEYLPTEVIERLAYCDKSAEVKEVWFNNKIVEPPEQLLQKYRDYKIIVTSTMYGTEIYEEFLEMGIETERCIFNSIVYDTSYK